MCGCPHPLSAQGNDREGDNIQTLGKALRSWEGQGRKITIPFREMDKAVDFRTGDLAILAAAPGGGKTLFAVNWAWQSADPILYLAQDSPRSVLKRLVAIATGKRVSEIREEEVAYWGDQIDAMEKRQELILSVGRHTVDDIEGRIIALTEWLGSPPKVVFIDNFYNLRPPEGSTYMDNQFYSTLLPPLLEMAVKMDVGIVIMHHVVRSGDKGKKTGQGTYPIRLTDLLFAGERESAHVWGTWRRMDNRALNVGILKQRDGKANPTGDFSIVLDWDTERMRLHDRR